MKNHSQIERQQLIFDEVAMSTQRYETRRFETFYSDSLLNAVSIAGISTGRALDIGTGAKGYAVAGLVSSGFQAIGIDVSWKSLNSARKNNPGVSFCCASADALPFSELSFVAVCANAVIEHVLDDERALDEMTRVSTGIIYIVVPNNYRYYTLPMAVMNVINDRKVGHVRHYDNDELQIKLKRRGFYQVIRGYRGHTPMIFAFLAEILERSVFRSIRYRGLFGVLAAWVERAEARLSQQPEAINLYTAFRRSEEE